MSGSAWLVNSTYGLHQQLLANFSIAMNHRIYIPQHTLHFVLTRFFLHGLMLCGLASLFVSCEKASNQVSESKTKSTPLVAASEQEVVDPVAAAAAQAAAARANYPAPAQESVAASANELMQKFPANYKAEKLPEIAEEYLKMDAAAFKSMRGTLGNDKDQWVAARLGFYQAWAAVDPTAAIADAQRTNGAECTVCAGAAFRGWLGAAPADAQAWLAHFNPGFERAFLGCEVLKAAAPENLADLSGWVGVQTKQPEVIPLINDYARLWSEKDPAAAATWLAEQEAPERFRLATEAIFSSWVKADPLKASEYLQAMPASPLRDRAVFVFATYLAIEDADSARTWGASIQSPEIKEECLAAINGRSNNS